MPLFQSFSSACHCTIPRLVHPWNQFQRFAYLLEVRQQAKCDVLWCVCCVGGARPAGWLQRSSRCTAKRALTTKPVVHCLLAASPSSCMLLEVKCRPWLQQGSSKNNPTAHEWMEHPITRMLPLQQGIGSLSGQNAFHCSMSQTTTVCQMLLALAEDGNCTQRGYPRINCTPKLAMAGNVASLYHRAAKSASKSFKNCTKGTSG